MEALEIELEASVTVQSKIIGSMGSDTSRCCLTGSASDPVPEGRWRAEQGKACITQESWLQSQDHLSLRLVSTEWSVG